uniref:MORN repeat containing 3 n=1 Tax=Hippocampus comes TaxID=109280 RepID=A0A3Q2XTX3_HIPCM
MFRQCFCCVQFYEGSFYKDYRHGDGMYSWPNGNKFVGKFYLNWREGYGKHIFPDGGLYHADQRFGPGVMSEPTGRQDVGLWHGKHLIQLCNSVPGSFSLKNFTEYAFFLEFWLCKSPFLDFDQHFFGQMWEADSPPYEGYKRDPLATLPLTGKMLAHIHKHRLGPTSKVQNSRQAKGPARKQSFFFFFVFLSGVRAKHWIGIMQRFFHIKGMVLVQKDLWKSPRSF